VFEFSVHGARQAARANQIDSWVDAFLTNGGHGTNLPMARGLKQQRRWWIGPLRVPLDSLTRICGPEPGMPYQTTPAAWEARVSAIAASSRDPEALPPLLLEYRKGLLALCDGNHRHEALRRLGQTSAWALVWCNSRQAYRAARVRLLDGRSA